MKFLVFSAVAAVRVSLVAILTFIGLYTRMNTHVTFQVTRFPTADKTNND
jgi:hypothetical protein